MIPLNILHTIMANYIWNKLQLLRRIITFMPKTHVSLLYSISHTHSMNLQTCRLKSVDDMRLEF